MLYPSGPFRRVVNASRWPPNDAAAGPLFLQPLLRHFLAQGELALLAVRVEDDHRLALLQGAARAGDAGFQGRVVAVVGALAGHEVFQQAGEGVGFEQVVGNQHGALQKTLAMLAIPRANASAVSIPSPGRNCTGCPPAAPGFPVPSASRAPADG